jgi:hypothetical protein
MLRRGACFIVGRLIAAALLCAGAVHCASAPPTPEPGRSAAWGYVELVRREGVPVPGAGSYGDRRVGQAELVDYSRPGFVVVYLGEGEAAAPTEHSVRVVDGRVRTHLEPAFLAVRTGDKLTVENQSKSPRLLSSPIAGLLRRLAPGQTLTVELPEPGEYELFVLDGVGASSVIFVAPGPMAVANESGRYAIEDAAPGRHALHTWHPRFPPSSTWVDLAPGEARRVDIQLGVGRGSEDAGDGDR